MSKSYVKDASGKWRLTDKQETPVVAINQQRLLSLKELEKLKKDINKAFDTIMSEAFH